MILTDLADRLRAARRASLDDLARLTGAAPDAIEAMLATLERKGRVRRLPAGSSCGQSCCGCKPTALTIYEWTGEAAG